MTTQYRHNRTAVIGREVIATYPATVRITAWRPGTQRPTVQGYAIQTPTGWRAEGERRGQDRADLGTFARQADAVRALQRHRSGVTDHQWTSALRPIPRPTHSPESCGNCGWPLTEGQCYRTHLHW